jgi:hypothetical protein
MLFNFLLSVLLLSNGTSPCRDDSVSIGAGSLAHAAAEVQEDEFQKGLNALFETGQSDIDTTAWNNVKINAGHFDSETWPDTARILLADSALDRFYVHPFKNCITSNFGPRDRFWHFGIDIRLSKGDSVRAAFNGKVRILQYDRHGFGKVIVVRHASGLETIYGHLCRDLVTVNQTVQAGQVIGLGGNTGRSSGAHLHFETRFFGEPFDPNSMIDFATYELKSPTCILTKADFAYLAELRKAQWHVVCKGETLGHIARSYRTTVLKLCTLNGISKKTALRIGRKLLVRTATPLADAKVSLMPGSTTKG